MADIFGIALFYISEKIKSIYEIKSIKKYFKRELTYNLNLLEQWEKQIDSIILKIATNKNNISEYIKYSDYQRTFTQECFSKGILYDELNDDEIANLNKILIHFNFHGESYINDLITAWKNNETERKEEIEKMIEFHKKSILDYKKFLKIFLNKFNK